jgi:pyruvate dehydrogenase E2 component (dihydrolipoamide acetyltransferase)
MKPTMPIPIILPKFGFTLETADIVKWLKHEGDTVRSGEPICEVTTDKVNMEVEAPENGTLYALQYAEGATVPVTQVLCYLLRPGEAPPAELPSAAAPASAPVERSTPPAAAAAAARVTPVAQRMAQAEQVDVTRIQGTGPGSRVTRRDVEAALTPPAAAEAPDKVRATPAARYLAEQAGIDLRSVAGTGPNGRIQASDVQAAIDASAVAKPPVSREPAAAVPQPVAQDQPRTVKIEGMRRTIASRLQKSFQNAPHIFFDAQIDATAIEALRARLKARGEKLSLTSIIVKACAGVLLRHPDLNATTDGERIHYWPTANIGVAVALEGGLIVPVVHHAERLTMRTIQTQVDDLAARARGNTLGMADLADGTFTISNLGMFGVDRFTAIINPPQVAILAVGRAVRQFVPDADDQPVLKSLLTITLSADHRVVDGAVAAQFMADLRTVLEDPALLAW